MKKNFVAVEVVDFKDKDWPCVGIDVFKINDLPTIIIYDTGYHKSNTLFKIDVLPSIGESIPVHKTEFHEYVCHGITEEKAVRLKAAKDVKSKLSILKAR